MLIIATASNAAAATEPETWDAELGVSYLTPVPPVAPVLATVTPVMTLVMSPSSPPGTLSLIHI